MENNKTDVFGDNVKVENTGSTADEKMQKTKKKEEKMTFNPLIVNLATLEVKDKTTESYYSQIKSNLYCSVKSHFLIARDLFDAQTNLSPTEYKSLVLQLKFTGTTQSKYLNIGKDLRLWNLFTKGVLPFKWTTQYFLTTLTDAQFNKVAEMIDAETPMSKIKKVADVGKGEMKDFGDKLLQILQLEVNDQDFDSVSTFEKIVDKVYAALDKIPEIVINEDKFEKAKEKIAKLCSKKDNENEEIESNKKMAKAILGNASAVSQPA